jgi:hypothetical protein
MKTIKIISIAIVIIMITGFISLAKDNVKTIQKTELKSILEKKVSYPDFKVNNDEGSLVVVQFTVNDEGKLDIQAMNYLDVKLGEYVKNCLLKVVVDKNDESVGKTHIFKFDFKLL